MSIKQHLKKYGYQVVVPTSRLVRHWWIRCLKEVFGYPSIRFLVPVTVDIRKQPDEWAACHWFNNMLHVTHHDEPISRYGLLTIICHEIAHAILVYEQRNGKAVHCEAFMAYAELVQRKTGLPFQDRYSNDHIAALREKLK